MHRATIAVTAGRPPAQPDAPLNEPVEFASALVAGGSVEYARHDARNTRAFEQALGALEGGHAVMFASGMAAITAVLEVLTPTSVARPPIVYSGTRMALDSRTHLQQEIHEPGDWSRTAADLQWLETPSNPDLRVIDIASASRGSAVTVVDNTFATPIGQRPLGLGADIVIHSVSKYLSGHSDLILGVAVCSDAEVADRLREYRELTGAIAGPMEAWLALRGLRTLDVRLRRAADNARIIAGRLEEHVGVESVIWPGLPSHPDHDVAVRQMDVIGPIISVIPRAGESAANAI
jgi:cystathionine gamma-synthase